MEEEKYTVYDMEEAPKAVAPLPPERGEDVSDQSSDVRDQNSEIRDQSSDCRDAPSARSNAENSENSENSESSENAGNSEKSPAEAEIQKMMDEMGADKVLDIIKDNRNSAIRQIISEVQAKSSSPLPSGVSAVSPCSSIFDLAALA